MTVVNAHPGAGTRQSGEHRPDANIMEDIWSGLWREDTIRNLDFNSVLVEVKDGAVVVWGHVGKDLHRRRIGEIIASVPGVTTVDNQLVVDQELAVEIAQALSRNEHSRPYQLNVNCMHGWVTVIGEVPTQEAREEVEEAIAHIPEVRGILNPPGLTGQVIVEPLRVMQPDLGSRVYNWVGLVGTVTRVVISPRNRLVTHFVVKAGGEAAGRRISAQFVLPVKTIEIISDENVILMDDVQRINTYPELDLEEFPLAPDDWRPPFPYKHGQVHWRAY